MFQDTEREIVMQETVMTRVGVDRILRYAFELASRRGQETPDIGHQVQWHFNYHALLG